MSGRTAYTPGPWYAWIEGEPDPFTEGNIAWGGDGIVCGPDGRQLPPTPENLRLQAAAPDLYEALKMLVGYHKRCAAAMPLCPCHEVSEPFVTDALAKAKGPANEDAEEPALD